MKITIIAHYPSKIEGEKEKGRFLYLGEMLSERGHEVTMLVSDFKHATKQRRLFFSKEYRTHIIALHEPGYKRNISLNRLWSNFQWGKNVLKYLSTHEKPDVIYCAVPSLTAGVKASGYCREKNIPFLVDIQDLWPEAFALAIRNKYLQTVFKPLEWYVNRIYKAADSIIAVSETYAKRALIVNRKGRQGLCVYLGNDGALFEAARLSGHGIELNDSIHLVYIGTLSYSYDLKCVIDALELYNQKPNLPKVEFVVIGDGPLRSEYERYALQKGIHCKYTGSLPYPQMVSLMCSCDILVNPIVKGAAQSITNKVGDYALSGLPVINTQENEEYRELVNNYNCGINCECGNANDVAEAIRRLACDKLLRDQLGSNGRKLGVERFDRRVTYKKIIELIEKWNSTNV